MDTAPDLTNALNDVLVRRGHELVLIAPLCTRPAGLHLYPFRRLEYLGTGFVGSDYLDILTHPNEDDEALTVLGAYLARRNLLVDLPQMDGGSSRIMGLMSQMRRRDWEVACAQTDVCPYIDFSGLTWDAFVGGLGRSHRTNFRRKLKKMHKLHEVKFDLVESEEGVLLRAGVERARGLVCAVDSDATNVYITLTARSLNPSLFIVALLMGLCTIPGTWVAAWIVKRTDLRIHTLFVEALIVIGGASFIYGSLTAG